MIICNRLFFHTGFQRSTMLNDSYEMRSSCTDALVPESSASAECNNGLHPSNTNINLSESFLSTADCNLSTCAPTEGSANQRGHSNGSTTIDVKVITLTFYMITFIFGIVGNSLVIYIIAKYDKIRARSVSNYYIWNLAFADELSVLTLPFFAFTTFTSNWIFGAVTCKVAYVFRECNKYASLLTLMTLSVDRYLATYTTMGRFRQIRVGVGLCVAIWAICLVLSTPYWLFSGTVNKGQRVICLIEWPNDDNMFYRQMWMYIQLVFGIVVPFAVIAIFNVLLLRRVRGRTAGPNQHQYHHPGEGPRSQQAPVKRRNQMNSSMTKVILVIVVLFAVCQLPYLFNQILSIQIINYLRGPSARMSPETQQVLIYFNLISQILVFVSSCSNPIIYGIFNKNYSKHIVLANLNANIYIGGLYILQ